MKNKIRQSWIILGGALLYNFLFWQAPPGLNALIFSFFLLGIIGLTHREKLNSKPVIIALIGTLLSASMVVWHNTLLAKFSHIFSVLILIGFLQKAALRFIGFAIILAAISFLEGPKALFAKTTSGQLNRGRSGEVIRWLKLTLIPLFLGSLFFTIYYNANAQFAALCDRLLEGLGYNLKFNWSPGQLLFFITGLILMSALVIRSSYTYLFPQLELDLVRKRPKKRLLKFNNSIALKNEYRIGLITIGLLNGILFIVNMTDLRYVWIEYEDTTPQQLSEYVHEGTYLLIWAILLAMLVLLYFFRKNLNFFPNNDYLKQLAYLWIVQNSLLALSVGMRNYHYINEYGLAYKRLGVIWFLILTFVGLLSFHQKIEKKKNLFYLLHVNGWVLYASLIFFSLINWDISITKYNLNQKAKHGIDTYFLTKEMTDKNLYLLLEHEAFLKNNGKSTLDLSLALEQKKRRFEAKMRTLDWRSWNCADAKNQNYLRNEKIGSLPNTPKD